jgi:hypothetical protein
MPQGAVCVFACARRQTPVGRHLATYTEAGTLEARASLHSDCAAARFKTAHVEQTMSTLVIKDLPESVELDREAMAAISGGARIAAHQTQLAPRPFVGLRLEVAGASTTRGPAAVITTPPRPTLLR